MTMAKRMGWTVATAMTLGACGSTPEATSANGTSGTATGSATVAATTTVAGTADGDSTTAADPDSGSESGQGSESGASTDTGTPDDCPFLPNPTLAAIPDNTALDLGRYECQDRMPQISLSCGGIFDFSRINYDPNSHRFIIFGGGHSASGRTDVDAFDMQTLTWNSLYPSMSCEEVEANNTDPRGFHIDSGHPVARHTYDQNVIAEVNGELSLVMFSREGFAGACHPYNAQIEAVPKLSLESDRSSWTFSPQFVFPWGNAGAAEFDPSSAMVVMIAASRGAGPPKLFVYDPSSDTLVHSQPGVGAHHGNLHYDPIGDRMILLVESDTGLAQYEIILDRDDWSGTTITELATTGTPPISARSSAYDSRNRIIGAFGEAGVFSALDLATDTWSTHQVLVQSDDPDVELGGPRAFAMDYDPINNVFLYVGVANNIIRTWAYRYLGPAIECAR